MHVKPAVYNGKVISKENFRVFIYDINGEKKLSESWKDFEEKIESGLWFATKDDAKNAINKNLTPIEEPKHKKKSKNSRLNKAST